MKMPSNFHKATRAFTLISLAVLKVTVASSSLSSSVVLKGDLQHSLPAFVKTKRKVTGSSVLMVQMGDF